MHCTGLEGTRDIWLQSLTLQMMLAVEGKSSVIHR